MIFYEKYSKILSKYFGKKSIIMCKACEISKIIINKCIDLDLKLTAPKLQKLLALMQGEYLASCGKPLFREEVLAWSCGVAIEEVNTEFIDYKFEKQEKIQAYIVLLECEERVIDNVLAKFGDKDSITINDDYRLDKLCSLYYEKGKSNIIPKNMIKDVFSDVI